MASNNAEVKITAVDKASRVIDNVDKSLNKLEGQAGSLVPALGRGTAATGALAAAMPLLSNPVGMAVVAIGGLAIAGGSAAMSAAKLAKEHEKLAAQAGVTYDEFMSTAYAFGKAGVDADQTSDILLSMSERMGQLAFENAGPLRDALDALGDSSGELEKKVMSLSSDQALMAMHQAMVDAGFSTEQIRFHMEDLASGSSVLTKIFDDNGKAVSDAKAQYDNFSGKLDEMDRKELAQFSATINTISTQMGLWADQIGVKFAEGFNDYVYYITHVDDVALAAIDAFAEADMAGAASEFIGNWFDELVEVDSVDDAIAVAEGFFDDLMQVDFVKAGEEFAGNLWQSVVDAYNDEDEEIEAPTPKGSDSGTGEDGNSADEAKKKAEAKARAEAAAQKRADEKRIKQEFETNQRLVALVGTEEEKKRAAYDRTVRELEQMHKQGLLDTEEYYDSLERAREDYEKSLESDEDEGKDAESPCPGSLVNEDNVEEQLDLMDVLEERWKEMEESFIESSITNAIEGIGQAFADAIVDGENFGDAMEGLGKALLKTAIQFAVEWMAIEALRYFFGRKTEGAAKASGYASEAAIKTAQAPGMIAEGAANAFMATSAIPIIGPAMAPGAAASAAGVMTGLTAAMIAGYTAAATAAATTAVVAHGGLNYFPSGQTQLFMEGGERIISKSQNSDLVNFMDSGGGGDNITVNINGGDPKQVERALYRVLKKRNKSRDKAIATAGSRGSRSMGELYV